MTKVQYGKAMPVFGLDINMATLIQAMHWNVQARRGISKNPLKYVPVRPISVMLSRAIKDRLPALDWKVLAARGQEAIRAPDQGQAYWAQAPMPCNSGAFEGNGRISRLPGIQCCTYHDS